MQEQSHCLAAGLVLHKTWCANADVCLQWKVAPALAAGNTIVLKPSEMASLTCLELGALATKAGLPAGVLNVITGLGPDAGAPLRCIPLPLGGHDEMPMCMHEHNL